MITEHIRKFAEQHDLSDMFINNAERYFVPLAQQLVLLSEKKNRPLCVGIQGCQGSGKSTLTDFLLYCFEHLLGVSSVGFSIDDFYLTHQERDLLGQSIHPLLRTRGVPGTHDIHLLKLVLSKLIDNDLPVVIPRFNKAIDDRIGESQWAKIEHRPRIILLEGWCVGVPAQTEEALVDPVNDLEKNHDQDGRWRHFVNDQLKQHYVSVFNLLDQLIMLKAPDFNAVYGWRLQQEQRLAKRMAQQKSLTTHLMNEQQTAAFIQNYQRLTEHAFTVLPAKADVVFFLNEDRDITESTLTSYLN